MSSSHSVAFPKTLAEAGDALGPDSEIRAGGTDFQERLEIGLTAETIIDLRDLHGMATIESQADGGLSLGAKVRLATLATDEAIASGYPALALAAGALATPQIRAVATLGGNLLQRARCWYYRHPTFRCYRSGGKLCPAREGDHLLSVCFDHGPCIAPQPSTLSVALRTYEPQAQIHGGPDRNLAELYGDGSDPTREHRLKANEILTAVVMPPPVPGERAGYFRAISRARAEWPLVEVSARLVVEEGEIRFARVAMGGVANVALRLEAVEAILEGSPATPETFEKAARVAADGANPLPMTAYKVDLIPGTVVETLERALGDT